MDTIGKRLTHLLKTNHIKLHDLANQIGVSKQTISLICNDKIQKPRKLDEIADIFAVSYRWLAFGDESEGVGKNYEGLILNKYRKIPVITSTISKELMVNDKLNVTSLNYSGAFELTSSPDFKLLFAMRTTNNALQLRFGHSTLIFHTELEPVSGDFVICYLPDKDLFVYRDLEIKDHKRILVPLDKHIYNTLTMRKQDKIVAVLYEVHQQRSPDGGSLMNTHGRKK